MSQKIKNKHHAKILREIKEQAGKSDSSQNKWLQNYLGTTKQCYLIKSAVIKQIARDFIKQYNNLSNKDYFEVINSLYKGSSNEELAVASRLLGFLPEPRKNICPKALGGWLENTEGWAEVDILCQSSFSPEEILGNWKVWKNFLIKLSKDKNIYKRRASLVLLVKSVKNSNDKRLSDLAFENIDKLKSEKEILITKAISWLLRDLIKNHRRRAKIYLDKNENSLPKIVVRETRRKLVTGKK